MNNKLVDEHWSLLRSVAKEVKRKVPKWISLDDLISAGSDGLMQAATRFDPSLGFKFETYARPRIRGAMWDWLRSEFGTRLKYKVNFVPFELDDGHDFSFVVKDNEWHKDPAYYRYEPSRILIKQETWKNILRESRINDRHRCRQGSDLIDEYYGNDSPMRVVAKRLKVSESRVSQLHSYILARFGVMISLGVISEDMFNVKP